MAPRQASTKPRARRGGAATLVAGALVAALTAGALQFAAPSLLTHPALATLRSAASRAMGSPPPPSPPLFSWGVASSAFQIEGAARVGGKGASIWDTFSHTPGKVKNNDTGDVACDFYHRYKHDVALMASLGAASFRFSLSWARLLPDGVGTELNPDGLRLYTALLDELAAVGIEPHVTLYHWDLPQALQDKYEGWLSPQSVNDFANYARLVFEAFGDRVTYWSTFNEPYTFAFCGHALGIHAPGRCSDRSRCSAGDTSTEPWTVSHHVLLAHAAAVRHFRALVPDGRISININAEWAEPLNPADPADVVAAGRYLDSQLGLYADPLWKGDYPESLKRLVPALPTFTPEQSAALKGSADYFLLNHYTSRYVKHAPGPAGAPVDAQAVTEKDGVPIGPRAASFWLFSVPWGFRKLLAHVAKTYGGEIMVTESGCDGPGEDVTPLPAVLNDDFRLQYFQGYVAAAEAAVREDGANITSYASWSLLDNFEWAEGYESRFGIVYVDYKTQARHPKASARWLASKFAPDAPIHREEAGSMA